MTSSEEGLELWGCGGWRLGGRGAAGLGFGTFAGVGPT